MNSFATTGSPLARETGESVKRHCPGPTPGLTVHALSSRFAGAESLGPTRLSRQAGGGRKVPGPGGAKD